MNNQGISWEDCSGAVIENNTIIAPAFVDERRAELDPEHVPERKFGNLDWKAVAMRLTIRGIERVQRECDPNGDDDDWEPQMTDEQAERVAAKILGDIEAGRTTSIDDILEAGADG